MYINPFWAGFFAGAFATVGMMIVAIVVIYRKQKKKRG